MMMEVFMLKKVCFFLLISGPWLCFGLGPVSEKDCDYLLDSESPKYVIKRFYPNFSNNPRLNSAMKQHMDPWLLPLDHKTKPILDDLFANPSVINSNKTLRKAGFKILFSQKRSKIRVIGHPKLKGYLIKLFPNSETQLLSSAWKRLTIRCIVAEKIKSIIARQKIRHFVVADKWLYPLPYNRKMKEAQPVVLIVRNMNIYNRQDTKHVWKNHISGIVLRELYKILGRGYGSAFLSGNLPYSRSGKFAFIDTEFDKRKIHLDHVKKFISPHMRHYWDMLVENHRL
jgi:hypothetical protein